MSIPTTVQLVAQSRFINGDIDLISLYKRDDFIWLKDGVGFIAIGSAIEVDADQVPETLAAIEVDDQVMLPGSGAIAVGALPFAASETVRLTIPQQVIGHSADGRYWMTEIRDSRESQERQISTAPHDQIDHSKQISENAPESPAHGYSANENPAHQSRMVRIGGTTRSEWSAGVSAVLEAIDKGEVEKVVLARDLVLRAQSPIELRSVLYALAQLQQESFIYAHRGLVGASPELLIRRNANLATSTPMAGTAAGTDAEAIASLANSTKDAREHEVVVEAVVGALAPYTVSVARVRGPEILVLPGVVHLATTIEADLSSDAPGALELARILHPTPAVGGWPVNESRQLIAANETVARGRYAGPVGWVDHLGNGEFAIALRSAEINGEIARCFAGAGIVAGSNSDSEWEETERKLAPMLDALGAG